MPSPPADVEVEHVEFLAGTVRYYHAGKRGSPIVLLHGGGVNNALLSWRHTIPALAADHRVYAPDLPGQGGSMPWYGRTNQRTYEETLRWLLDAWELPGATLVGLSMGASVAAGFAARQPARVRGLVLVDPLGTQRRRRRQRLAYGAVRTPLAGRFAALSLRTPRLLAKRVLNPMLFTGTTPSDSRELAREVRAEARNRRTVFGDWHREAVGFRNMRTNLLPALQDSTCPSLVVHGARDRIVPLSAARATAETLRCPLRVLDASGHWPNRDQPDEFNTVLHDFLGTLRPLHSEDA